MKKTLLRIATRKSALALWQANHVKNQLQNLYPKLTIELLEITTSGDKNLNDLFIKLAARDFLSKN